MQTLKKQQIKIQVIQPQTNNNALNPFVTYLIVGSDKNGQFSIRRRYNQFYLLREVLVQNWIGLYIPPIASKKITGNKQQKFVQQRKRFLHYFCLKIAQRPYLFYSKQFQKFIRYTGDIQNTLKQLSPIKLNDLLREYQYYFHQQFLRKNSAQHFINNQTDYDLLKKAEKKFDNLRQQFKNVAQIKKTYTNQFFNVYNNILPEYQQNFLLNHVGKDRNKMIMNVEQVKQKNKIYNDLTNHNALEDFIEMISYQLRQTRALIQAIQTRKKIDEKKIKLQKRRKDLKQQLQKLQAGRSTLKSIFSPGSKQKQVQKNQIQIKEVESEIQTLNKLIPLMYAICNKQINDYKLKRGKQYMNTLNDVAKKQMKQLYSYGQILKVPLNQFI